MEIHRKSKDSDSEQEAGINSMQTSGAVGCGPYGGPECMEIHRKSKDSGSEQEAGINSMQTSRALG